MKKHFVYFTTLLLALGFVSCSPNGPEWEEQYREASCTVVQFVPEAAEYRQNVMLVPDSNPQHSAVVAGDISGDLVIPASLGGCTKPGRKLRSF